MRNIIDTIKVTLAMLVVFGLIGFMGHIESNYTRKDCVVVSNHDGVVTVEDKCGYLWEYDVEGVAPAIGTVVDLRMNTNHTDGTVYDDYIVDVIAH